MFFQANGAALPIPFKEKFRSLSTFIGHPNSWLTMLDPSEVSVQIRDDGTCDAYGHQSPITLEAHLTSDRGLMDSHLSSTPI